MTNADDEVALDSLLLRYRDGRCTDAERAHIERNPALLQRAAQITRVDDTMRQLFRMPVPVADQLSPEEIVAFVMGVLDEPRRAQLAQRATHDPLLQAEIDLIRDLETNPLLEQSSFPQPAELRPEAMTLAQPQQRRYHGQQRRASRWSWPLSGRRVMRLALAGAVALLVVWGSMQQVQIRRQQAQLVQLRATAEQNREVAKAAFGNDDSKEGDLKPTSAAPQAFGRIFISPSAPAVALYVKHLPPLPSGREYQLWLTHNEQHISIDKFMVDPQGRAWRLIQPPQPLSPPDRISITMEPIGGSTRPTGPEFLGAAFTQ